MPYDVMPNHPGCPDGKKAAVVNVDEIEHPVGCYASEADARHQADMLNAAEPPQDMMPQQDSAVPQRWRALLAQIGVPTSDGRIFDALTWRDLPLSLLFQPSSDDGHDGAVIVGRIDEITRLGNEVWGAGEFLTPSEDYRWPAVAMDMIAQKALKGVSVDAAVLDMTDSEDGLRHFSGEIGAATLVAFPAFANASIELVDAQETAAVESEEESLAVSGSTSLPLADRNRPWDGGAAQQRVKAWAGGDTPNAKYAQAFFIIDGPADQYGSYHLQFGDVIGGTLTAVPRGIIACAGAVQGARGAKNPAFQQAKGRIAGYYRKMDMTPPWENAAAETVVPFDRAVGLVAAVKTVVGPPAEWFDPPQVDKRRGLHVEADGRIWGHLYGWGECHEGSPKGQCITIPRGGSYEHIVDVDGRGVITADGSLVQTGPIFLHADHAPTSREYNWVRTKDHYANTGLAVADVRCGEDQFGIWVAGMVRPGTPPEHVHALRASAPSGDWRPFLDYREVGGRLQLVGILQVNVPAYPGISRNAARIIAAHMEGGRIMAMVASGAAMSDGDCGCGGTDALDEVLARLAAMEHDLAPIRAAAAAERAEIITELEQDLGLDADSLIARMAADLEVPA